MNKKNRLRSLRFLSEILKIKSFYPLRLFSRPEGYATISSGNLPKNARFKKITTKSYTYKSTSFIFKSKAVPLNDFYFLKTGTFIQYAAMSLDTVVYNRREDNNGKRTDVS